MWNPYEVSTKLSNFLKKLIVVDNEDVGVLDSNLYWLKSELMAETAAVFI